MERADATRPALRLLALAMGASGALVAGGCTLLVSTSGLATGASDDASPLAPSEAGDSGNAGDSGTEPVEAAPSEAAAAGFCAGNGGGANVVFCDDFDTHPFGTGWSSPTITNGGAVFPDSSQFVSAPFALATTTPPQSSAAVAFLQRTISSATGHYRIRFAMRVAAAPDSQHFQITFNVSTGGSQLELLAEATGLSFNDRVNGQYGTYLGFFSDPNPGQWRAVDIRLYLAPSGTKSSFSASLNGVVTIPTTDIADSFSGQSAPTFAIGSLYGGAWSGSYDNVLVTAE